ncbi:MAG: cbb3-type cytochrome c oxidase subunit I [Acidimicrobiales bacterium]
MALTETRPETHAHSSIGGAPAPLTIDGILGTGDHKLIGRIFIAGGVVGLIGSLVLAVVSIFYANNFDSLAVDGVDKLPQVWSLGRDLALFGGLVPIMVGLAVYLVPLQIGAPSLAFPRGAAAALWTWLLGSGLLILAYVFNGGPGGGRRDFVVLWAASLAMMVGGLVWAMVCIATTALGARTKGMTLERVPQTTWAFLVFSLVGIFSLPILMAELLLAFLNIRYFHLLVSESAQLTAVMDSVNLAPALYWIGIPVLGMSADIIGVHTGRPVKMHKPLMAAIGLFGIMTFAAGELGLASVRGVDFNNGLLVVGLLAVVLPILAVLGMAGDSIRNGTFVPRTALLGALLSGLLLLLGAVVALLALVEPIMGFLDSLAPDSIDMTNTLILNGTRFHEAIRALVIGSAVVGVIGAVHHWATKIWGRRLAESLGIFSIAAAAAGSVVWAAGEVAAGFDDQPWLPARATEDYASGLAAISLIGVALLAAGAVILGANMAMSFLGGKNVGSSPNTWSGTTLEWATASPPPVGNFPGPPIVTSATPLADGELQFANSPIENQEGEG